VQDDHNQERRMTFGKLSLCVLPLLATVALVDVASSSAAEIRLECNAEGPNDISMHARFERRDDGRRKFSTEFEAAPGGSFSAGQRMTVLVAGVNVGSVRLRTVAGGDLQGDLNLDTEAGPGDDERPFPPGFPQVVRGTRVLVKIAGQNVLGCRLR
jgi:hypothetical protein